MTAAAKELSGDDLRDETGECIGGAVLLLAPAMALDQLPWPDISMAANAIIDSHGSTIWLVIAGIVALHLAAFAYWLLRRVYIFEARMQSFSHFH